ncbi:SRPBCC family protein [Gottfriedia acidiceleris]|uniref:SRPBCC family protein n=1 Tax=Gottfriedia acidiceleris TaxID=371036 RepID=UPI002FFDDA02
MMITMNNPQNFTLKLNHVYPVKREKVFAAWTKPALLEQWWGPQGYKTKIVEMNVEVQGNYKFIMRSPNGIDHIVFGQYLEILPSEKLVFTWQWEQQTEFPITIVTVDFLEIDGKTEVIVTHSNLPNEDEAKNHTHGWTSFLEEKLTSFFQ